MTEDLRRLHAVFERETDVDGQLDRLAAGDQGGEGDDAAIGRR